MNSHKHVFKALILTILVLTIYETTYAKSVYVINDTGSSEMQAYKVTKLITILFLKSGDLLVLQLMNLVTDNFCLQPSKVRTRLSL